MFTIGVFAIILDTNKKILLCHRRDYDLWNLPGGGLEDFESPTNAVKREVKEKRAKIRRPDSGKNDFYKNLTFHRVEPGFVIQGGDPLGNGTGGGQIASEINDVPFKEGSVGLARGADIKVSNDSQFFICLTTQACQGLSNQYVNFGEVVSGMDVAQKIAVGDKILSVTPDTK